MLIRIGYDIEIEFKAPVAPTALIYMLQVHPSRQGDVRGGEHITISPPLRTDHYLDAFDNHCARVHVDAGVKTVRLRNDAAVHDSGLPDVQDLGAMQWGLADLPVETLRFLLPSRYCEVDSELLPFAWKRFSSTPLGWARVQAICDFAHQHVRFDYQRACATRGGLGAYRERVGVCRDFTHLAITLCRCMNIPARYVTGYLGDIGVPAVPSPMDFSAWFEVWLGQRWHTFDARHNVPRIGRIPVARGLDAADVPITMAFGEQTLKRFEVRTEEVREGLGA